MCLSTFVFLFFTSFSHSSHHITLLPYLLHFSSHIHFLIFFLITDLIEEMIVKNRTLAAMTLGSIHFLECGCTPYRRKESLPLNSNSFFPSPTEKIYSSSQIAGISFFAGHVTWIASLTLTDAHRMYHPTLITSPSDHAKHSLFTTQKRKNFNFKRASLCASGW